MKFARTWPAVNRRRTGDPVPGPPSPVATPSLAALLTVALLVLGTSTLAATRNAQPFYGWYFHWAWYSTLVAGGAAYALATGKTPASGRLLLGLFCWSAPLWFLFELINFRVANWYYVFASEGQVTRTLGAFAAFATVLPAIYLAYRWIERSGLGGGLRGPRLPLYRYGSRLVLAGVAVLILALWRPAVFFPLVWGFLTLLLEPWNYRRAPERSLLGDLRAGRYDRLVQLLAAGAAVGLMWEAFNSLAGARWIYTVPGLEGSKLFEMPIPGFLGFPVFALDCFVAYQALANAGLAPGGWGRHLDGDEETAPGTAPPRLVLGAAVAAVLVFGIVVAEGMSRWTIDSTYPKLKTMPGASPEEVTVLQAAGVRSVEELAASHAADLAERGLAVVRAETLVTTAGLATLRGIGVENARALLSAGIDSICALAQADPVKVAATVRAARSDPHAGRLPRVRVWVRSAGRSCPAAAG